MVMDTGSKTGSLDGTGGDFESKSEETIARRRFVMSGRAPVAGASEGFTASVPTGVPAGVCLADCLFCCAYDRLKSFVSARLDSCILRSAIALSALDLHTNTAQAYVAYCWGHTCHW
jgi:hypothetical protein